VVDGKDLRDIVESRVLCVEGLGLARCDTQTQPQLAGTHNLLDPFYLDALHKIEQNLPTKSYTAD
jgi:hypothetical protein